MYRLPSLDLKSLFFIKFTNITVPGKHFTVFEDDEEPGNNVYCPSKPGERLLAWKALAFPDEAQLCFSCLHLTVKQSLKTVHIGECRKMECCNVREDRHFPPWLFRALFPLRRLLRGPLREVKAYLKNGMTALDAGSGPGFFTPLLSRSVGMSGKVISIDSDGRMVTAVESLAKRKNLDNVTCRIASAASMNFVDDSSVDFLISSGILCCLSDHRGAVSEIKRVLKTTGVAVISVSKHLPESDPRTVTRREWESILREFNVVHRSETFLEMRATVSLQR